MPIDVRLNAIVDAERAGGHDLVDLARRVAEGGATLVQLRDKRGETRAMVEEARAIKAALVAFAVPFVVNDRVDVALAAGADGVHIGPDDMTVEDARALLGPDAIIGLSIKTVEAAAAAPVELIDYAGIGGVFSTTSKEQQSAPIGTEGLAGLSPCSAAARKNCRSAASPASTRATPPRSSPPAPTASPSSRHCRSAQIRPPRRAACAKLSMPCWRSAAHDENTLPIALTQPSAHSRASGNPDGAFRCCSDLLGPRFRGDERM